MVGVGARPGLRRVAVESPRTATSSVVGPLPFRYSCAVKRSSCTGLVGGRRPDHRAASPPAAVADCSVARTIVVERTICCSSDGATRHQVPDR